MAAANLLPSRAVAAGSLQCHASCVAELPRGTVSLLFTDIEGSTQLQHRLGERYREVVNEHRRLLEEANAAHDGQIVERQTGLLSDERLGVRPLGSYPLKDFDSPEPLYQLRVEGLPERFPRPRVTSKRSR